MESLPCAVIASSCASITPQGIIKDIFTLKADADVLPKGIDIVDDVKAYPWEINTKYYDATIHLCAMNQKTLGSQEFADSVQAMILCFDSHSVDGLIDAAQWLPFVNVFNCDVKVLVCEYCPEVSHPSSANPTVSTGIDRVAAVTWCIKNGFELVELNPQTDADNESDLEDDFPETVGVKRIAQALEAHIWPNMVRKVNKDGMLGAGATQNDERAHTKGANVQSKNDHNGKSCASCTASALEGQDEDDDLFEALFEQLSTMKSKASDLPTEDRKDYAEKMAVAFWRAMGGDETEIEDLGMGGGVSSKE